MKSRVGRRRGSGWDKSHRTAGWGAVLTQELVHYYAAGRRHVEGVLHSQHGDAHVGIREPGDLRPYALHFVTEDYAYRKAWTPVEQVHGMYGGFHGGDLATHAAGRIEQPERLPVVFPGNR
jgi:hypothetical protein